jgi:lysozyme
MTPTEKLIYDEEDEVLHAYQDHLGFWTIGIGHLIDKRKGGRIPVSISRELFALDIREKTRELTDALPWTSTLDEARFAALLSMVFQMGIGSVLGFPKMLLHMKRGEWQAAHDAALDSDWARIQTPARAQRTAKQILTGVWHYAK